MKHRIQSIARKGYNVADGGCKPADERRADMKRTEWVCMVASNFIASKTQRVYKDDDGKLYIRVKGEYKCIDNLPCKEYLVRA